MVERRLSRRWLTRRDFLGLGAGAGAGLVLAGCGGGSTAVQSAGGDGGKTYKGPKVDLAFWNGLTGGEGPYIQELVQRFKAQHKNINVSMNIQEWETFYQKVPSAVRTGEGPDVAIMHHDQLGTNAARGVIIPLDDVANALGLKEDDFTPVVWQAAIYNNQRYGIPLDIHPLGFYYNKGTMEKGGLDPNNPPQTRDDYEAALEELKGKGIEGHWISPFEFTGALTFMVLLWQFGGDLYNEGTTKATFNSEAGVEALEWMVSLIDKGYSPKNVALDAEFVAFQNGDNAFMFNGIWNINPLNDVEGLDWGVSPIPQIGTERATWAGSHHFAIMNKRPLDDNKVQASKVFINWVSQQSIEYAKAGQIPARASVRESQAFKNLEEQSIFAKQLPYVHFTPTVPGIADVAPTTWHTAVNEAVLGKTEPQAGLDAAAGRANQLLEENQQKYQA